MPANKTTAEPTLPFWETCAPVITQVTINRIGSVMKNKSQSNLEMIVFTIAAIMMATPFIVFAIQKLTGER